MPTYRYTAKKGPEDAVVGVLDAESPRQALDQLSGQGYFPLRIEEFEEAKNTPWAVWRPVPKKELGLITRQLADLFESHIPLLRALQIAREQTSHPTLQQVLKTLMEDVQDGRSFSEALKKFPAFFSPLYISLVCAGEASGMLAETLDRLAVFMEQEEEFRSRIRAAMAYPLLVAGVGAATVIFLMGFVVPRLSAMFMDSGQGLPWIARFLTALSRLLTSRAGWGTLIVLCGLGMTWVVRKPEQVRTWVTRVLFQLPVWRQVMHKSMLARFSRTLAMLLAGGVPILPALRIVSDVLELPRFRDKMNDVLRDVEQGDMLSHGLRRAGFFPPFVCQMMAIGEEANQLEKALHKIAAAYERDTDRAMKLAVSLLEPAMILAVGSVIGTIVVGMLLPIFEISTFVK